MSLTDKDHDPYPAETPSQSDMLSHPESQYPADLPASEIFLRLTADLQQYYSIAKGLLVIKEPGGTRFVATATFSDTKTRKNLAIKLPATSSLFEKVAEDGAIYSENCTSYFSGNSFERNLLLTDDSAAFMLQPLKHDGRVVGILGFSSEESSTFTVFESGILDDVARLLGARIASANSAQVQVDK